MKLAINTQLSIDELDIINIESTHCTIRTADLVPFFGDYVCVDVEYNEFAYNILTAELKQASAAKVSDYTSMVNQVKHRGSLLIQNQLNDYIVEMLNSQAISLGQKPFTTTL